jgi:hypothetical protein
MQGSNHSSDGAMLRARTEHFQALFFRAPLQNIDIDMANAPAFHFQASRLVKIDRFCAHQRCPVIVDNKFLLRIDDPKSCAKRIVRPVGGSAHYVASGQIPAEGVAAAAAFRLGVCGSADMVSSANVCIGRRRRAQWPLQCGLLRATNQKRNTKAESYKFNRFTHWQHGASDSIDATSGKQLFAYQRIRTHPLNRFLPQDSCPTAGSVRQTQSCNAGSASP